MWEVVNATGHWSDKKTAQQEPTVDHWCGWSMAWSWFWVTADGWLTADFQTDFTTMELSLNCVFTQPWKILTPQKGLTHFLGKRNLCFPKSDLVSVFHKPTTFHSLANLATQTWSPHDSLPWSLPVKSQSSVSRHFWLKSLTYKTVSLETSLVPKTSAAAACAVCKVATRSSARVASRTLTVLSSSAPCAPPACHTSTTPLHRHSGQDFEPLGWADKVKSLKVLHHPAFVRLLHFRILATF